MKIIKPASAALLYRTLRFGGRDLLSIGVLALFRFGRGGLDGLSSEGELWQLAAQAIGAQVPLDAGLPKPRAEFLAYGAAYAPGGEPATLLPAAVAVGAVRKELYVFGDRHFNAFGQISAPQPFQRMPIEPARAYGGAGFAANPSGRGAAALPLEAGGTRQPLPNIEAPAALIASSGDVRAPAGFWAWPASMPERERLLGAFDQRWLAAQWPHLPEGTQTEYFCSAPPDQRIEGFWRGDEPVAMHNMHPSTPRLQAALPGLRARCFVHRRVGETMHFEECAARAETVWLFPELEQGIVLYRAVAPLADEDADDVLHVMADWENLAATPLPIEAYQDRLLAQIAPVAAPAEPAIQTPAAAVAGAAVTTAAPATAAAASLGVAEIEKTTAELEAQTQALLKQHGLTERDLAAVTPAAEPEGAPPTLEAVARMTREIESETAALLKRHNLTPQDVEKFSTPSDTAATAPFGAQLRDIEAQTRQMLARSGMTPAQLAARAEGPELAAMLGGSSIFDDATIAKLEALMQPAQGAGPAGTAQAGGALAAGTIAQAAGGAAKAAAAAPSDTPTPAPRLTREEVLARATAGQSLAGLDLSELDLSAATLEGADFSGALLAGTRFTGSRLARANLSRCLLRGADLSGADLRGARLDEASAGTARFTGTQLDSANLDAGDFAAADFNGASLAGAHCARANFEGAQMAKLRAAGCQAEQANFGGCALSGADFSEAQLRAAQFDRAVLDGARFTRAACEALRLFGVRGAGACFDQADLRGSRAGLDTDLSGADFTGAKLDTAAWLGIDLRGAIFDDSSLEGANFSGVQAAGASFARAHAQSMRLGKADLSGADLRHANLFKASLRRTRLDDAQLQFSNLYGADCYGSTIGRARLEGANLERTLLAIPGRAEAKA